LREEAQGEFALLAAHVLDPCNGSGAKCARLRRSMDVGDAAALIGE
jgi:hypothetical protein